VNTLVGVAFSTARTGHGASSKGRSGARWARVPAIEGGELNERSKYSFSVGSNGWGSVISNLDPFRTGRQPGRGWRLTAENSRDSKRDETRRNKRDSAGEQEQGVFLRVRVRREGRGGMVVKDRDRSEVLGRWSGRTRWPKDILIWNPGRGIKY
jgi:hypothetical protein